MTNQFHPSSQPETGRLFPATEPIWNPQISQTSIDTLIAGLHMAEINLDYVEIHRHFKQASRESLSSISMQGKPVRQPFNMFMPGFTAYIDGIEREARQTADEFNLIIRHIGGLPVKVTLGNAENSTDGSITVLKDYKQGAWVCNFTSPQHQDGIDLHGDTNKLRLWHSATLSIPNELNAE